VPISTPTPNPWPYYRQVEAQIAEISQIVQLIPANGRTFGNRIAELIVVIGSEIDSNLRICTRCPRGNIIDYLGHLRKHHRYFTQVSFEVDGLKPGRAFRPFPSFTKSPRWWKMYNAVKHNRFTRAADANVTNLMQSFAGLYLTNAYLTFNTQHFGEGYHSRFIKDLAGLHNGKRPSGAFGFSDRNLQPNYNYFTNAPRWPKRSGKAVPVRQTS
jgi:hypothetical protein